MLYKHKNKHKNNIDIFNFINISAFVLFIIILYLGYSLIAKYEIIKSSPNFAIAQNTFAGLLTKNIGTKDGPFQISTYADLLELSNLIADEDTYINYQSKYYVLLNDIELDSQSWIPIGNKTQLFMGVFDGNGHTIKLSTNSNITEYYGLFGYADDALIKNLNVEIDIVIDSSTSLSTQYIGGVISRASGATTITGCSATGEIEYTQTANGQCYIGGIIGYATRAVIVDQCYNETKITANASTLYLGGISGRGAKISNCYNTAKIKGTAVATDINSMAVNVGGISGCIIDDSCTVDNCFNTGSLTATGYASSRNYVSSAYCAGISRQGKITDCYNTGRVITTLNRPNTNDVVYNDTIGGSNSNCHYSLNANFDSSWDCVQDWKFSSIWGINSANEPYLRTFYEVVVIYKAGYTGADDVIISYPKGTPFTLQSVANLGFSNEGKAFLYWLDSGENQYNDSQEITLTQNLSLTAQWGDAEHKIELDANGGSFGNASIISIDPNELQNFKLSKDELPTKLGYEFTGFYSQQIGGNICIDCNGSIVSDTISTNVLTLYAQWKIINYTITYLDKNGNIIDNKTVNNPTTYNINTNTITFEPPIAPIGYEFVGWSTATSENPQLDLQLPKGSTGNITLYANFEFSGATIELTCTNFYSALNYMIYVYSNETLVAQLIPNSATIEIDIPQEYSSNIKLVFAGAYMANFTATGENTKQVGNCIYIIAYQDTNISYTISTPINNGIIL